MSSQHADRSLTVRPPEAVRAEAKRHLAARDRKMQAFVVACLTTLNADPDGFLATLEEHWPPPKRRGRPRRDRA